MNTLKQKQSGFTIVELLIVIVVIGILAAITIVAYNGITDKANNGASQTGASQAAKLVMSYMAQNSDQVPVSLAAAGLSTSGNTTYAYTPTTSTNPQKFCITATTAGKSYYVNNTTQRSPASGTCSVTVYTTDFNSGFDSWAAATAATTLTTEYGRGSGGSSIQMYRTSTAGTTQIRRTITGLTVGVSYTFSGWTNDYNDRAETTRIGVSGIGSYSFTGAGAMAQWVQRSYTFTATATSHILTIEHDTGVNPVPEARSIIWDDLTVISN